MFFVCTKTSENRDGKKLNEFQRAHGTSTVALQFCSPCNGQDLVCSFNDLVGRQLALFRGHWASENEKLLAQEENLVVLDDGTAIDSSPRKSVISVKRSIEQSDASL